MIVDGREIATGVLARTKARASTLARPPKVVALVGADTPATRSYLSIKHKRASDAGCILEVRPLGSAYDDADAVIIQLPLPQGAPAETLNTLPVAKDADVLSRAARERFERGDTNALLPPVVGALDEIFKRYAVEPRRKRAAVVGAGFLVGAPSALWLRRRGALVKIADNKTENLARLLRLSDIIVAGAGVPHLIKPNMLKEGAILIDAGTSESLGAIAGDASPLCADKCSLFTPVPGGVGPLAVAKLFENAVTLATTPKP